MKHVKKLHLAALALGLLSVCGTLQSCDDDPSTVPLDNNMWALVSVRPSSDNSVTLQLNDSISLRPTNVTKLPFGNKEVRALTNVDILSSTNKSVWDVRINRIDSIRTKQLAPSSDVDNDKAYGNDPVEIVKDWVTCAEDGYLTLRIRTRWGSPDKVHYINLIKKGMTDNVYELELHHNASGDIGGQMADALVAFDLSSLPRTEGDKISILLTWTSFSGRKSAQFLNIKGSHALPVNGELGESNNEAYVVGQLK